MRQCDDNEFEPLLAECLDKGSVHWGGGGAICECTGEFTLVVNFLIHRN